MKRRIIAIDPGLKTGMSVWEIEEGGDPVLIWAAELDESEYAPHVRTELAEHPHLEVVCERFIINAQTAKKSQSGWSLELIGVLKQCLRDVGRSPEEINFQNPSDAMKMFPNPQLKKLGYWYRGGAGHALDSIRHGLLYLVKSKWKPKGLLD